MISMFIGDSRNSALKKCRNYKLTYYYPSYFVNSQHFSKLWFSGFVFALDKTLGGGWYEVGVHEKGGG